MASPQKNVAYTFYLSLGDSANPGKFKAAPTIAAGDFQVSTDGSGFADLATLPVVEPTGSIAVKVSLSATEMDGEKVVVRAVDAAGGQWDDALVFIEPATSSDKTGYSLAAAGLDSIVIETGLNARQAISLVAAACVGAVAGAATNTVTVAAAANPATSRVAATVDASGNRTSVILNPPS